MFGKLSNSQEIYQPNDGNHKIETRTAQGNYGTVINEHIFNENIWNKDNF